MKSFLSHIQFNIKNENMSFYKDLMQKLGYKVLMEGEGYAGYTNSTDKTSIWFIPSQKDGQGDYDLTGVNHVGFNAESIAEVDEMVAWIKSKNVQALFETPRHRPEFSEDEHHTYYQVMFETPDKLLVEVVYTGKK